MSKEQGDKRDASRLESRLLSMIYEGRGMYPGCAVAIDAIAAKVKAIFAASHVAPKREWEGYCSAEVEETVKEIDKIFGDGKMTDTSRDWGQMCAIASMVVRVRAAVKAEYAPSTTPRSSETPRADAVILGDWEFWSTENGKACDKTDYDALAAVARALDREATYWRKAAETTASATRESGK